MVSIQDVVRIGQKIIDKTILEDESLRTQIDIPTMQLFLYFLIVKLRYIEDEDAQK